jgi:hypothetical protein
MADKYCVNCKHYDSRDCKAPENRVEWVDVVTGQACLQWRLELCTRHRLDGWLTARIGKTCGKEGRWFVPNDAEARS